MGLFLFYLTRCRWRSGWAVPGCREFAGQSTWMSSQEGPNPWRLAHVGFEFAIGVLLMTLGGWWLDSRLGTEPWLLVTGALLGAASGMYRLVRVASSEAERQDRADKAARDRTPPHDSE